MRQAGILCPISSLPGKGVGDFGSCAYTFVDKLKNANVSVWQILPLNPLSYGNSPYQPYSSYAGDELYLDLEAFIKEGLLNKDEVKEEVFSLNKVDYTQVRTYKESLYRKAFERFTDFEALRRFEKEQEWLYGYALFRVFKLKNEGKEWREWEDHYKLYPKEKGIDVEEVKDEVLYQEFLQYYFNKQWYALKEYANKNGIEIIGDMPIYVGLDSADVWLNQENFLLEEDGTPSFVAGVPPDYFSKTGQRWGNPIYNWDYMEQDGFTFWLNRISYACKLYDIVRIDHFRGFDTYWKIPEEEETAVVGEWVEAPGYKLFDTLFSEYPDCRILAEDLGELRDEVYELRDHYTFPGMFVYMFHHHDKFDFDKVVVYTGTHDNDTIMGWHDELTEEDLNLINEQLRKYRERKFYRKAIHYCMDQTSKMVIIPIWDLLGLPGECRFNVPGTIGSPNWEWKLNHYKDVTKELRFLKKIIEKTNRA
ncbi:4-alpha-glucanotransferase [Kandleria vitulina]|uniref:4-alpha-glucanotransferase n=1 Tax=Kandleria vitulina TaxID=1630 RepID=UPI000884BB24|nr:4-alpha-glucanotransferase [Kandleria vitulina]SDL57177.1 4-alpha-glucanotransferase [Kandleria vitulina]